jgi:hypothetical protein
LAALSEKKHIWQQILGEKMSDSTLSEINIIGSNLCGKNMIGITFWEKNMTDSTFWEKT